MSKEKKVTTRVGSGSGILAKEYRIGDNIKKVIIEIDVIDYRNGCDEVRVKFRKVYHHGESSETCEFTRNGY
jgi:hypothetical protein